MIVNARLPSALTIHVVVIIVLLIRLNMHRLVIPSHYIEYDVCCYYYLFIMTPHANNMIIIRASLVIVMIICYSHSQYE